MRWPTILGSALLLATFAVLAYALDPPHNFVTNSIDCSNCHTAHKTLSGPGFAGLIPRNEPAITNLCLSCHVSGGSATNKPFADNDQAYPSPGLPTGVTATGTSHRWDSGASGHVEAVGTPLSTGTVQSGLQSGTSFTARYAKTYTITTTGTGTTFSWNCRRWPTDTDLACGSGTGNATGTTLLNDNITVTFTGPFVAADQWRIYVRPDINQPDAVNQAADYPYMNPRIFDGKITCSACHNQHLQTATPFDSTAPAYGGPGTGANRHFQRVNNDTDQMCKDCHSVRNVGTLSGQTGNLSHPVGVTIPAGLYKTPTTLPLDKSTPTQKVQCMSCHKPHFFSPSPTNDGTLLRVSNHTTLCTDCHTNSDTVTPAAHLNATTGVLWPGGQYGSDFPQITDTTKRGFCTNCHQPHGWPDNVTPSQDFPTLLVDREENLCYTCHDTNGPAGRNAQSLFINPKTIRHPVLDSEQAPGRSVECTDCHNAHKTTGQAHTYSTTADLNRNQVSNAIKGVLGWAVNYTGLGNFVAPAAGNYSDVNPAVYEYQICFKCHSGKSWSFGTPPNGLSPNGTVATPVQTDLAQEFSPNNKSGHPIVTGLNSYPNSGVPKALTAAGMSAPWSTNLGTQTMMCSDCHNTDAASPAAQGPHGSAVNFMLRGPNVYWPTNSAGAKYNLGNNTSGTAFLAGLFCLNCHPMRPTTTTWVNNVHTEHSGPQGNFTPDRNACVSCHIVIPHGGKVSRLIATRTAGLPARYAYSNTTTNVWVTAFIKAASPTGYATGNCSNAGCSGHVAITGETW